MTKNSPTQMNVFAHEFWVGFWRILFYWLVVYLAVIAGRSSASHDWGQVPLLDCFALSTLFLPFLYLYCLLFELATPEHFPQFVEKRKYLSGPYRRIGWLGIALSVPFALGYWYCLRENLVPVYVCVAQILFPCGLAQTLLANRYCLLQKLRKEPSPKPFYWMKAYLYQLGVIVLLIILVGGLGTIGDRTNDNVILWLALASALLVYWLGAVMGYWLRRSVATKQYFFEYPFRELIALISVLALPFAAGVASGYFPSMSDLMLRYVFTPKNGITMAALVLVGLVFELMRYLARYQSSFFARPTAEVEGNPSSVVLPASFQRSVQRYTLIHVSVLSLLPLLCFFTELSVKVNLMIIPFTATMICLVFVILRPHEDMGFEDPHSFGVRGFRRRCVRLASCNVFGYVGILVILIVAFCNMSGGSSVSLSPHAKTLITVFLSGFITVIVGVVLSSVLAGEGAAVSGLSITVGVITQALIVGTIGWIFFSYFTEFPPTVAPSELARLPYWDNLVHRLAYQGDAVYLGITYIVLAMLLLMIAAFDRVRVSRERSRLLSLLLECCPALPQNQPVDPKRD